VECSAALDGILNCAVRSRVEVAYVMMGGCQSGFRMDDCSGTSKGKAKVQRNDEH
jgi:hypothetical protein